MHLGLDEKVVLISGGTSGLGLATARRLAEEGARVAVCGRDEGRCRSTARWLAATGADAIAIRADIGEEADVAEFVERALERWGRIDGILNNAGSAASGAFESTPDAAWHEDLRVKLLGPVHLIRTASPTCARTAARSSTC